MLNLPKGATTKTARQSKWLFWGNAVLAVGSFLLFLDDVFSDGDLGVSQWVRLALVIIWCVLAVMYFRSWRAFKRAEVE